MQARHIVIASLIVAIAGATSYVAVETAAQSREAAPALNPGEQALNINAVEFNPFTPGLGIQTEIESFSGIQAYMVTLQLPQGSVIKRIGFWGKDNDNGARMTLELRAQVNDADTTNVIKRIKTSFVGASDTYQFFTTALFSHTMKWNRSYYLYLLMDGTSAGAPNFQQFRYARIIYEPAP